MTADLTSAESLAAWKRWLGIESCTCPFRRKGLGVLYGISMGSGWVRMLTVRGCPHHGE